MLGWTEAELLSRPVEEFMHPADRERTLLARAGLAKGVPVRGLENRYICKDGTYRWLSWQSSIEPGGSTVFAVARDITDQRRAEQENLVLSKLESTGILAGGIAHDFNNLLTSLMLNLEMVAMTGPLTAQQDKHLRQAQETGRAAQTTTQQLVMFANGGSTTRAITDLRPLLTQSLDIALSGSNVAGEHHIAADLWRAEVDEAQFAQVIRSLVLNAREAMPSGGAVRLRADNVEIAAGQERDLAAGKYVRVTVTDQGAGVPPAILAKVFDPYFSTKQRGVQKGMGLGLTICHAVIQKHGGAISIDAPVGRGATFTCFWPASSRPLTIPVTAATAPVPATTLKVLVMDDEESMREILAQTLGLFGHTAELAPHGEAALGAYQVALRDRSPFDVVLLDLTVKGGMGGAETLEKIRQLDPRVEAVLMTGYTPETALRDYVQQGFRAVLTKPFRVENLRQVLGSVATGMRAERAGGA